MNRVLAVTAAGEAVTGIALLVSPPIVVHLLFGAEIAGAGIVMSRIAGIALIALGIACWPGADTTRSSSQAYGGMLTYSALTTLCLAYVGLAGESTGKLLWPAAVVHVILTVVLALAWSKRRTTIR
ncbi:MAG: hypothetical protein MOB07_05395 [Acidobacteria bacterium]|nr:hypothetical protein [Acidobacteriota bacterium]